MKLNLKLLGTSLMALSLAVSASAQNITLRYGQIPSTIKTVSALQFHLAQRKGFFAREGISSGNDAHRGRRRQYGRRAQQRHRSISPAPRHRI